MCLSKSNLEINLPERVCYVKKNVLNDDVKISTVSILIGKECLKKVRINVMGSVTTVIPPSFGKTDLSHQLQHTGKVCLFFFFFLFLYF